MHLINVNQTTSENVRLYWFDWYCSWKKWENKIYMQLPVVCKYED